MVEYPYVWTPLVIVAMVALLAIPWLGLIALMIATILVLGGLAALAWAIIVLPYRVGRAIWHGAPLHLPALGGVRDLRAPHHTVGRGHVS